MLLRQSCTTMLLRQLHTTMLLIIPALLLFLLPDNSLADNYLMYYSPEEFPAGSHIGDIVNDYGLNKRYNRSVLDTLRFAILIQPGFDQAYVAIDELTGVIRSTHKVDREAICPRSDDCTIKFDVAVKPIHYFEIIKVKVVILDTNDNYPMFPDPRLRHQMSESAELGSGFVVPAATDMDSGRNGIRRYELLPADGKFELVVRSGVDGETDLRLVLREKLNREVEDRYQMAVYAIDGGEPPKTGSILIDVTVQDANDNNPEFENSSYQVTVPEDLPVGTVLLKVRATDRDSGPNGMVTYDFSKHTSHEYGSLFGIRSDTGKIYLQRPLDFEQEQIHLLSVTASDQGPDSLPSHASVVIRVEDVNDNTPTINVNTLTLDGQATVEESSEPGTFVAHVSVLDPDSGENGRIHCVIDTDLHFQLQKLYSTEYKLVTSVPFDREQRDLYLVTITCNDHGITSLTSQVELRVHVTDINDHSPTFVTTGGTPIEVSLEENSGAGSEVMIVQAFDEDTGINGHVSYSLDTADDVIDSLLSINASTGVIQSRVVFDREQMDRYTFRVIATDLGIPSRSSSVSVLLRILDEDDERPMFPSERYTFHVPENEPPGTEVGVVVAIDRDLAPNNKFKYRIEKGSLSQSSSEAVQVLFDIEPSTGQILTRQKLDRESRGVYHVTVAAVPDDIDDGDQYNDVTTTVVTIQVTDVNDNRPFFLAHNETVAVSSFATPGFVITVVKAGDDDIGQNANITYTISSGNKRSLLALDSYTGELKVNKPLSSIAFEDLFLSLMARDGGSPPLSGHTELRVVISKDIAFPRLSPLHEIGSIRQSILADEGTVIILAIAFAAILVAITVITVIIVLARMSRRHIGGASKPAMVAHRPNIGGGGGGGGGGGCGGGGNLIEGSGMGNAKLLSGNGSVSVAGGSVGNGGSSVLSTSGRENLNGKPLACLGRFNGGLITGGQITSGQIVSGQYVAQNGSGLPNGGGLVAAEKEVEVDRTSSWSSFVNLTNQINATVNGGTVAKDNYYVKHKGCSAGGTTKSLTDSSSSPGKRPVVVFIRDQKDVLPPTTLTTNRLFLQSTVDDGHDISGHVTSTAVQLLPTLTPSYDPFETNFGSEQTSLDVFTNKATSLHHQQQTGAQEMTDESLYAPVLPRARTSSKCPRTPSTTSTTPSTCSIAGCGGSGVAAPSGGFRITQRATSGSTEHKPRHTPADRAGFSHVDWTLPPAPKPHRRTTTFACSTHHGGVGSGRRIGDVRPPSHRSYSDLLSGDDYSDMPKSNTACNLQGREGGGGGGEGRGTVTWGGGETQFDDVTRSRGASRGIRSSGVDDVDHYNMSNGSNVFLM